MNMPSLQFLDRWLGLLNLLGIPFGGLQCFFGLRYWKTVLRITGFANAVVLGIAGVVIKFGQTTHNAPSQPRSGVIFVESTSARPPAARLPSPVGAASL
jgi:hypothetical protein